MTNQYSIVKESLLEKHGYDEDLPTDSLLYHSNCEENRPKLLVTITAYNEPYRQFCDSLAGIYRAYYELISWDESYLNKVQIVMVLDGYDRLGPELLKSFEKIGLYNSYETAPYKEATITSDKSDYKIKFKGNLSIS